MTTKIVFLDIDGTCYDVDSDYVADSLVDSVYALKEKGIKVCICTGRGREQIQGISKKLMDLPFDAYITSAGAESFLADGTVIHREYLEEALVRRLIEYSKSVDYELDVIFIDNQGGGCLHKVGQPGMFNFDWFKLPPYEVREVDYASVVHLLFAEKGHHDEVVAQFAGTKYFVTSPESVECYHEGVDKYYGVKAICDYYGIPTSEAMAFGDGDVDVEMLSGVGLGIAMGNACKEAKNAAKEVCEDMFSDGIANTLKRHGVI